MTSKKETQASWSCFVPFLFPLSILFFFLAVLPAWSNLESTRCPRMIEGYSLPPAVVEYIKKPRFSYSWLPILPSSYNIYKDISNFQGNIYSNLYLLWWSGSLPFPSFPSTEEIDTL